MASGEADYCDSIGSGEMFVRYSPVNCYWVREIWGVFDTDPAARIHLLDQIVQSVNLTIHGLDWQGGPFQRPAGSQPSLAGIGYGYRDLAVGVSWSPAPIPQIRLGDTPSPTLAGPADGMTPMYFRIYQQPSRTVLANSAGRYVFVQAMMSNYFDAHHPPTASPT